MHTLRSNISIIPQVPFLFKGTVRFNIDPFGICKDNDNLIWNILKDVKVWTQLAKRLKDLLKVWTWSANILKYVLKVWAQPAKHLKYV